MTALTCDDCARSVPVGYADCPHCGGAPVTATRPVHVQAMEAVAQDQNAGPGQVVRHLRFENRMAGLRGEVAPGSEVLLGRDPRYCAGAALLGDDSVSRRHVTLGVSEDGEPWARDEYSTNGTRMNEILLSPGEKVPVRNGNRLRLGEVQLLLSRFVKTTEGKP